MKIGILREYKEPEDIRVALTPSQCKQLMENLSNLEIVVEPYAKRCFSDSEYQKAGVALQNDLRDCDVLIGVKEVPKDKLIPNKTYFFFSHTIKEQDYNLELMRTLLNRNITMIDHETLVEENGARIIGFGRWAGIVGAHYALLMMGKKSGDFSLKPANECADMKEMLSQYEAINWPKQKIVLTGDGRVGKGALEVLKHAGIRQVSPDEIINQYFDECVFAVLGVNELYKNEDGSNIDLSSFYKDPTNSVNAFMPYTRVADVLIHGIYWDYRAPALFSKQDIKSERFKTHLISDITCDVEGSIPITLRQTPIADPYIGIDKHTTNEVDAFGDNTIDVMAVGNLPNELPRDASTDFGNTLMNKVVYELFDYDNSTLLKSASICHNGKLTDKYSYLQKWVDQST
ncbi:MAG: alanine dehydrogenase [Bacteroidia bacterium]